MTQSAATIKAVVAYAAKLRGDAERNPDPWFTPYAPTEAAARKMCQRYGPDQALTRLRQSAAARRRQYDDEQGEAKRAQDRHRRQQRQGDRDRNAARQELTLGQRLDQALASASMIAAPPASPLDGDRISVAPSRSAPRFPGDPAAFCRHVALDAVRKIESELDEARHRTVHSVGGDSRDERLRRMRGLNPRQVALADPDQGSPRMVRDARRGMGLDPESGNELEREQAA